VEYDPPGPVYTGPFVIRDDRVSVGTCVEALVCSILGVRVNVKSDFIITISLDRTSVLYICESLRESLWDLTCDLVDAVVRIGRVIPVPVE
jgi:hypothetical protein